MNEDSPVTHDDESEPLNVLPMPQEGGSYLRLPDGSLIRNEPAAVESPATDDQ